MHKTYKTTILTDAEGPFLRIPEEFILAGNEVVISRIGNRLIVEPRDRKPLLEVLASLEPIEEEFPEIEDPAVEPEGVF